MSTIFAPFGEIEPLGKLYTFSSILLILKRYSYN